MEDTNPEVFATQNSLIWKWVEEKKVSTDKPVNFSPNVSKILCLNIEWYSLHFLGLE